jgi:hypothetical protein
MLLLGFRGNVVSGIVIRENVVWGIAVVPIIFLKKTMQFPHDYLCLRGVNAMSTIFGYFSKLWRN